MKLIVLKLSASRIKVAEEKSRIIETLLDINSKRQSIAHLRYQKHRPNAKHIVETTHLAMKCWHDVNISNNISTHSSLIPEIPHTMPRTKDRNRSHQQKRGYHRAKQSPRIPLVRLAYTEMERWQSRHLHPFHARPWCCKRLSFANDLLHRPYCRGDHCVACSW